MIQQTSLESYIELQPELGQRQQIVYDAFKTYGPSTDMEICKFLGYGDANKVRPRRFELVTQGFLELKDKRKCKITDRTAIVWCLAGSSSNTQNTKKAREE
jgi:hypothetical protein